MKFKNRIEKKDRTEQNIKKLERKQKKYQTIKKSHSFQVSKN